MSRKQLLAVLAVLLAGAMMAAAKEPGVKNVNRTVALNSGGLLRVETYKGSVQLEGWERDQVQIEARIEPPEDVSDAYARQVVEATEVEITGGGSSVRIRSDYDRVPCQTGGWDWLGCSKVLPYVHYTIRAPRRLELELKDHKSRLTLAHLEGRVDLDSYKGEIQLSDIEGTLHLETYKGVLEADNLRGTLALNTYKGEVKLTHLRSRVQAETYKGEITIRGLALEGDSRLQTERGRIELVLPASQGFTLEAQMGRRADFWSDFEMTTTMANDYRTRGQVNGGGPRLSLESNRGTIFLRRQP
ncbi:MAG: DUF4097 family beta strand repeat-containing protein [Candidatus Acidiferrales bacterium]